MPIQEMTRRDFVRGMTAAGLVAVTREASRVQAAEPKTPAVIDAKTIEAWKAQKARQVHVGLHRETGYVGSYSVEVLIDPIPGFQFARNATEQNLKALPPVSVPFAIDLGESQFGDASLKHLRGVKNLTSLLLWGENYTDACLEDLTSIHGLATLSLLSTKVTDRGLGRLKTLKHLTGLALSFTGHTDEALEAIKELKQLKMLNLHNARVTDDGMKHLKNMTGLSTLNLKMTGVSDAGLRELQGLKELSALYLLPKPPKPPITDEGMKTIAGFEKMTILDLEGSRVSDKSLPELKKLKNLSLLLLKYTDVSKSGVEELKVALPTCKIVY